MKTGKTLFFLLAAIGGLVASSLPASAQMNMKYSFSTSATNPIAKCIFVPLAKEIEQKSQNRIKAEMYFGRSGLANPRKAYRQLAHGITDLSYVVVQYSPGKFPLTDLGTMPFLVKDNVASTIAINKLAPKYLAAEFSQIRLLSLFYLGPYQLHMKERITKLSDIRGKRLRVIGGIVIETLEKFGALPVSLPISAIYENLQKGVIDGTVSPFAVVPAFKIGEVTQAHIHLNLSGPIVLFGLSKKFYRKLPKDLKPIFDDLQGPELGSRAAKCFQRVDKLAVKMATGKGNAVVKPSDEEMNEALKMVAPIRARVLADLDKKGLKATEFYTALEKQIAIEESALSKQ